MRRPWRGVIEEYREWLPLARDVAVVSLGEGGTPLVRSDWLSELTGCDVWLKVEAGNPTGSFKDRGMTVAVSQARAEGARAVVCASTGNTSASMSAYAARAGLAALVLVPEGRVSRGKLVQTLMHGAQVIAVRGGFDDCLRLARGLADAYPVALVNSVNPMRIEGQKTAAFEVVDSLGAAPAVHALPVGNAGNITAYWLGFREYAEAGLAGRLPAMWGFQAAGAAPLVRGRVVANPHTVASAIRIGNPASWQRAVEAVAESGGVVDEVVDEQILDAQRLLAGRDGVFAEPASAAGAAGLVKLAAAGHLPTGEQVTVTVTGHGLKDVETALEHAGQAETVVVDVDVDAAAAAAGLR